MKIKEIENKAIEYIIKKGGVNDGKQVVTTCKGDQS